ncbi:protransforming growth factor alpha isoform X3 [Neophocaena asiaeorientalis asiaeorientalis]|uniref:Protransforming growth factor alpha isoform X3 n=1 Tax=Neophocaena asiaeorientalis asiaeorientalis TaxID=1706337 RepID=A0A341CCI1_NEOAA|nr:protransforming growth factor alpha isoform X3 [Neophocaena asiaeorientalis asiaeorientalis]XP_032509350.1 protransforming growth factor alpha isoform X1 [Phocoena sinus]
MVTSAGQLALFVLGSQGGLRLFSENQRQETMKVARVDIATPSRVTCPPWVGATGFWEEETPDEAPLPPAGLHTSIPPLGRGNAADRGHVRTCALSQGPRVPLRSCAHPTSLQDQKEQIKNITTCSTVCLLLAVCQALENSTSALSADPPVAAAVVSHFNDCPASHSQFCFHGTCRFLVQEDKPACVCHSGYVGARCEHADLLAVVAASQKKQAITALVVVSVVALTVLIITCVLIHCCQVRKHCEWCRALICRHEKPSALLKGRTACCHSETVV